MNDKKQIEEMAVILTDGGCTECNCDADGKFNCLPMYEAELLYNADYRKQSVGEWVKNAYGDTICSNCGIPTNYKAKYCAECGAKMKGGAE